MMIIFTHNLQGNLIQIDIILVYSLHNSYSSQMQDVTWKILLLS